jgi:hypothetical protein
MLHLNAPQNCSFHTTNWATFHVILELSQALCFITQIFITVMCKVGKARGIKT